MSRSLLRRNRLPRSVLSRHGNCPVSNWPTRRTQPQRGTNTIRTGILFLLSVATAQPAVAANLRVPQKTHETCVTEIEHPGSVQPASPNGRSEWKRSGSVTRVLRGGSWNNNGHNCRAAYRNRNEPDSLNNNNGFRLCLPLHFPMPHSSPSSRRFTDRRAVGAEVLNPVRVSLMLAVRGRTTAPPGRAGRLRPNARPGNFFHVRRTRRCP